MVSETRQPSPSFKSCAVSGHQKCSGEPRDKRRETGKPLSLVIVSDTVSTLLPPSLYSSLNRF